VPGALFEGVERSGHLTQFNAEVKDNEAKPLLLDMPLG